MADATSTAGARPTTYTPMARFLHWLIAAIILIIILLGGLGFGYPYGGRPAYWGGGYGVGGVLGLVLLIILILALVGRV